MAQADLKRCGQDFFYFDQGAPRLGTVLVLHGFPDTPHSFAALSEALATAGYRVLRPFLPGYAPDRFQGPFDIGSVRARMLEFIETLELVGPLHLVGHDWGAVLSYALLHHRPELFAPSVTMSAPHPLHFADPKEIALSQLSRSAYMLFFQVPALPEAWLRSTRTSLVSTLWRRWSPSYRLAENDQAIIAECLRSSGSAPFAYYRKLLSTLYAEPRCLGDLEVPLLYLHGEEDGCITWATAQGQERYCKAGYHSVLLRNAGHFLQAEVPEEVATEAVAWFQGKGP